MPTLAWLGFFLSLNHTAPVVSPFARPVAAVEATAVVGVGKLTATTIFIQPVQQGFGGPVVSVGLGVRIF